MDAAFAANSGQVITTVAFDDRRYPPLLRHLADAPRLLYVRGNAEALLHPRPLAVVGTRGMTAYGAAAIKKVVGPAAGAGVAIVSGLALGVDAACHQAALDAGGVTIAVLAGGVDAASVGPRTNANLAERIVASGGALISEQPPGFPSHKGCFPQRNRIVAAMCTGTLVIEAPHKSGALITARVAADEGRDVYVIPGSIFAEKCAGTNAWLRTGATPITCAEDLFHALGMDARQQSLAAAPASPAERLVLAALRQGPADADTLGSRSGLPARDVSVALSALQLRGIIDERGGIFMHN